MTLALQNNQPPRLTEISRSPLTTQLLACPSHLFLLTRLGSWSSGQIPHTLGLGYWLSIHWYSPLILPYFLCCSGSDKFHPGLGSHPLPSDVTVISAALPSSNSFHHIPRSTDARGGGGGVVVDLL